MSVADDESTRPLKATTEPRGSIVLFASSRPAKTVSLGSLFQGVLVHHHETRGIPESVALFLGTAVLLSVAGVMVGNVVGLFVVVPAMSTGMAAQTAWLAVRSRRLRARM